MVNKKFLGLVLALVMVFSLGASVAFADANNSHSKAAFALGDGQIAKRLSDLKNRFEMKLEDAKARFDQIKVQFDDIKDKWIKTRENFVNSKFLDSNALFPMAKNYLLKATDHLSNYLEVNRAKVLSIESKSGIDTNTLIAKIDIQLDDLNSLKPVITDANSTADIKAILPQINSVWDSAKLLSKETVGYILAGNTSSLIDKVNGLSDKVNARIAAFDANGIDTNVAAVAMTDFSSKIASARVHVQNAVNEFNNMAIDSNSQTFFISGHDELKLAHTDLRVASKDLKDAARSLNSSSKNNKQEN